MISNSLRATPALAVLCTFIGCSDPISDVKFEGWEPELAAPIVNTSFTLRDALNSTTFSSYLTEDDDTALRLSISQPLFEATPASSLQVPDLVVPLLDSTTNYNLADEGIDFELSRIDFNGGYIVYRFSNQFTESVTVDVSTANFSSDGLALRAILTVPPGETVADSVAAAGMRMELTDEGNIEVNYRATTASGNPVRLAFGALSLSNTDFVYAEGSLTELEVNLGKDSIRLDMLDAFEAGEIQLIDPVARLVVDNEVGVPFRLRTPESFATLRDGSYMALQTDLGSGFSFDYPSITEGKVSKNSSLVFDASRSNFVDVINQFPSQITMSMEGQGNPDSLSEKFFIHEDARISGRLEIDMPLAVRFNGFEVSQEFAFDGSDLEQAVEAAFVLNVNNGFGLNAEAQVYFYDESEALIDSLFGSATTLIAAAEVDALGAVITPNLKRTEIELSSDKITSLSSARSASVSLRLTSPNAGQGVTRLYYNNEIGVQLGARVTTRPL